VRTARAKGAGRRAVLLRHALRNALLPIVTTIGLQFGALLGGAVLTESVFAWPGVGRLLVDSIGSRDYPVVQGVVLLLSLVFIAINLLTDLAYAYVDPRIRYG
jgi:peptide/nickel transport system permease protein